MFCVMSSKVVLILQRCCIYVPMDIIVRKHQVPLILQEFVMWPKFVQRWYLFQSHKFPVFPSWYIVTLVFLCKGRNKNFHYDAQMSSPKRKIKGVVSCLSFRIYRRRKKFQTKCTPTDYTHHLAVHTRHLMNGWELRTGRSVRTHAWVLKGPDSSNCLSQA